MSSGNRNALSPLDFLSSLSPDTVMMLISTRRTQVLAWLLLVGMWMCGPAFGQAAEVDLTRQWELTDTLDRPESALYDASRNVVYVSSMGGSASEKDGNGYISTVSPGGEVLQEKWASGLNAPKGMALSGDTLYTADIDALVALDAQTGAVLERWPAEGARFLNDVTADAAGRVYVSDSRTNALYRLSDGRFAVWKQNLPSPNGVYAEDGRLVVAAADAEADDPGSARYLQVIRLDENSTRAKPLADDTPLGGLDAVVPDGQGGYFLSDWAGATVLHFHPDHGLRTLSELTRGTADLDYAPSKYLLFVPVMMSNRLVGFEVEGL